MEEKSVGLQLSVELHLRTTDAGGRTTPIRSGFRPICVVSASDGAEVLLGLCELQLEFEVMPGGSGVGTLSFAPEVSDEARLALGVGTQFSLAEGRTVIGYARVLSTKSEIE